MRLPALYSRILTPASYGGDDTDFFPARPTDRKELQDHIHLHPLPHVCTHSTSLRRRTLLQARGATRRSLAAALPSMARRHRTVQPQPVPRSPQRRHGRCVQGHGGHWREMVPGGRRGAACEPCWVQSMRRSNWHDCRQDTACCYRVYYYVAQWTEYLSCNGYARCRPGTGIGWGRLGSGTRAWVGPGPARERIGWGRRGSGTHACGLGWVCACFYGWVCLRVAMLSGCRSGVWGSVYTDKPRLFISNCQCGRGCGF